jgi:uncharacterized protein
LRASTAADVAIIVFAKAPIPGLAKTRLIPRLGAWEAARLQARLTAGALRTALAAGSRTVELHGAPGTHRFLRMLGRRTGVPVSGQRGNDLGMRMGRALERALRKHRTAILIGSDCPVLKRADLRRAVRLLQGGSDAVLAPTEDGGYALIGLRRSTPGIFSGIAWGSETVYATTARKLDRAGYRWRALRTLWDVDRPQDLDRLKALRFPSGRLRDARQ